MIDLSTRTVEETVDLADETSHEIGSDPGGEAVYVGEPDAGTIHVISTDDTESRETIETGSTAHGVDVSPDGSEGYGCPM